MNIVVWASDNPGQGHIMRSAELVRVLRDRDHVVRFETVSYPALHVEPYFAADWVLYDGPPLPINTAQEWSTIGPRLGLLNAEGAPSEVFADLAVFQGYIANFTSSAKHVLEGLDYIILRQESTKSGVVENTPNLVLFYPSNMDDFLNDMAYLWRYNDFGGDTLVVISDGKPGRMIPGAIFVSTYQMWGLYEKARAVVTAFGMTMWESIYWGIPTVVRARSNQLFFAEHLDRAGLINLDTGNPFGLRDALHEAKAPAFSPDGLGANRIVTWLENHTEVQFPDGEISLGR